MQREDVKAGAWEQDAEDEELRLGGRGLSCAAVHAGRCQQSQERAGDRNQVSRFPCQYV